MPPSYRLINYSLRPAKTVERKLLCDLFRRLDPFGGIRSYRYIGFGSIYFTDFQLFHQALDIVDMVSIERDTANQSRFDLNKPYRCIDLKMGHSNVVLPTLSWDKRCTIWLDYDGKLDKSVLADVATIVTKAPSGTVFVVSINAEPERKAGATSDEQDELRLQRFAENVGDLNVPGGLSGADLRAGSIENVYRRILLSELAKGLAENNGPLPTEKKRKYRQLINLNYSDDAQMMTLGVILYDAGDEKLVDECDFRGLAFYRDGADSYQIRAPRLTPKEIRSLNVLLPKTPAVPLDLPGVPLADVEDYAKIYRYYPSFVESFLG